MHKLNNGDYISCIGLEYLNGEIPVQPGLKLFFKSSFYLWRQFTKNSDFTFSVALLDWNIMKYFSNRHSLHDLVTGQ